MSDFSDQNNKDGKSMSEIFSEIKKSRYASNQKNTSHVPKYAKKSSSKSPQKNDSENSEKDEIYSPKPIKESKTLKGSLKDKVFFEEKEKESESSDIPEENISENNEKNTNSEMPNNDIIFYSKDDMEEKKSTLDNTSSLKLKRNLSKKRIVLNVFAMILGIVMIAAGSGFVVAYSALTRINYHAIDTDPENISGKTQNKNSGSQNNALINPYDGTLLNDSMVLNILLFGADTRKGSDTGNSDTIILMSIDTRHRKLKLTSFMRDTYVSIPGYDDNKLTAAYSIGGADLAVRTVQSNYGIQIDRYAVVDFGSFKNIINTLGGIDIELSSEEIDYINWQSWVNNQVDTRYELDVNSYTFHTDSEGNSVATVHLNGRQALWHARNRGQDGICSGDDYTRTQRQRNVISILINRMKSADTATIMSVIYEIGPMITTNLKTSEIAGLASNITKYLQYDMVSKSLPESMSIGTDFYYSDDNNPIYIDGMPVNCIVIYDWESFRRKVADFIFEDQIIEETSGGEPPQ